MGKGYGVEPRARSIRLFFVVNGERFKETLKHDDGRTLEPTAANLQHARRIGAKIRDRIDLGTFVLAEFFPHSPRAEKLPSHTFGHLAGEWLKSINGLTDATVDQYTNAVEVWKRLLGEATPIAELTHQVLAAKIGQHPWASPRLLNNYLIPLRGVFAFHYRGPLAAANPLIGIQNRRRVRKLPDPLTPDERDKVLADLQRHYDARIVAYYQFAFFTGMRPQELIALQWGDIDWNSGTARVRRVRTFRGSERDGSKTHAERDVDLVEAALEALEAMKPYTFLKGADADIFENPVTGRPWHDERSQRDHYWKPALRRCGVRHRRSYVTRHTYCTAALMNRVPAAYIAAQAGHSLTMLLDVYARWIPGADGGQGKAALEAAMQRGEVPQKSPNDTPVIGRRDWTRTNSKRRA